MTTLTSLPLELIHQICSEVCDPQSVASFRPGIDNLSRLSPTYKSLSVIAQPLVFSSFYCASPPRRQQCRLLRTLDMRPDLAQCLRYFKTEVDDDSHMPAVPLSHTDTQHVDSLIAQLGPPFADLWPLYQSGTPYSPSLRHNPHSASFPPLALIVELILLRTPNLEILSLPLKMFDLPLLLDHIRASPQPLSPRLHSLQTSKLWISLEYLTALCSTAPLLRDVWLPEPSTNLLERYGESSPPPPAPPPAPAPPLAPPLETLVPSYPALSNLRRLEFYGAARVDSVLLRNIMMSTPQLEVLAVFSDPACDDVAALWETLMPVKDSLRELRFQSYHGASGPMRGLEEGFSLVGFGMLEVLKMG